MLFLQKEKRKMKIGIAQLNVKTLDIQGNSNKMLDVIRKSNDDTLVVFGEMALTGYPLYNKNLYDSVVKKASLQAEALCKENKSFIFGTIVKNEGRLFNSLVFIEKGEVKEISTKRNLNRFDDNFSEGNGFEIINFDGNKIAFGFLEDVPNFIKRKVDVDSIIVCSNVLFDKEKSEELKEELSLYAKQSKTTLVFVNRVGAEGSFIFNGESQIVNDKGERVVLLPTFEEKVEEIKDTNALSALKDNNSSKEEKIYQATVLGIRDYFTKNNIKKAVIGLSGGIDSAVVVVLAVKALGKDNVTGILMPSEFSTEHSITDAEQSAINLGIKYYTIPIKDIFQSSLNALNPVFEGTKIGTAEENLQARARCMLVMGIANKIGAGMMNTSNKSESAVGYGTLYGDDSGAIGAIGDLFKTEVYKLANYINKDEEIIPKNSIIKAPSAELHYDQKDSDSLPEYDVLDKILKEYIENHLTKEEIINKGFEKEVVEKVLTLINRNEWKRHQEAPALRLSKSCFTTDFINPIS
jgi:NAD+ synthase (glutamine-hydrolysing)